MQRYHMMVWRDDVAEPVEHVDGEWVRYSAAEAEHARLRAEVEKLRADVVWAVRKGAFASQNARLMFGSTSESRWDNCVPCDGTDAGLLDAVRREREQG